MKLTRLVIENKFAKAMTVFVERHDEYYWLMPGDALEVQTEGASRHGHFDLQQIEDGLVVYPSANCGQLEVIHKKVSRAAHAARKSAQSRRLQRQEPPVAVGPYEAPRPVGLVV